VNCSHNDINFGRDGDAWAKSTKHAERYIQKHVLNIAIVFINALKIVYKYLHFCYIRVCVS